MKYDELTFMVKYKIARRHSDAAEDQKQKAIKKLPQWLIYCINLIIMMLLQNHCVKTHIGNGALETVKVLWGERKMSRKFACEAENAATSWLIPSFSTKSSGFYAIFTRHQNTFTVSLAPSFIENKFMIVLFWIVKQVTVAIIVESNCREGDLSRLCLSDQFTCNIRRDKSPSLQQFFSYWSGSA